MIAIPALLFFIVLILNIQKIINIIASIYIKEGPLSEFIENRDSLEDLQTHLSAPHMLEYREKVMGLDGPLYSGRHYPWI